MLDDGGGDDGYNGEGCPVLNQATRDSYIFQIPRVVLERFG